MANSKYISSTLSSKAFWMVNKKLSLLVGITGAILISDLISKRSYFEAKGQLDDEGGFFLTSENIENDLQFGRKKRRSLFKEVQENGFVTIVKKGVPSKNWFYIHDQAIEDYLKLDLNGPTSGVPKDPLEDSNEVPKGPTSGVPKGRVIRTNNKNTGKGNKLSVSQTEFLAYMKSEFDRGNEMLQGHKLSYQGKGKIYGEHYNLLIGQSGCDKKLFYAKAKVLYTLVEARNKKTHFYKGSGFTPTTLMSNWMELMIDNEEVD